jgi:hypothetical protein
MAKRKKRVAARKPTSNRGNARRKNLRKEAAKRPAPKKAEKSAKKTGRQLATKVRRGRVTAKTPARKKKQIPVPAREMPIETTIIDVIEEPAPGVMVITEFESVRVALPDSDEKNKDQGSARKNEE